MIAQGVKTTARCNECGGVLIRDIGQHIEQGRLWWGIDDSCTACPNASCRRGSSGATQEVVRQALLAEHGAVRLRLVEQGASSVSVLQALRESLHLPLHETRAMTDALGKTGLLGTRVEMELLADALRRRSVATTIEAG